ncbi:MAG: hypothetical protein V4721_00335 [Bacteroidota bacterium]
MSNIDFSFISRQALANAMSILQRLFPSGRMDGPNEFRVGGLDGHKASGKGSLSVNINTGKWADFATGQSGGDLVSLLAARDGMSQKDAADEMLQLIGMPKDNLPQKRPDKEFIPDLNPPKDPQNHDHYRHKAPSATWIYRNAAGERMFYMHRFDIGGGDKEICPQVYGAYDGKKGWWWRMIKDNRPLYGLDRLAKSKGTVVVVEGEKCADALQALAAGKLCCVTWSGGTGAVDKTDWTPLKGRKVVIWPDADQKCFKGGDRLKPLTEQPGYKASQKIAYLALKAGAEEALVMEFEHSMFPDGWDVADAIAEKKDFTWILAFIKGGIENAKKKTPEDLELTREEKLEKKKKEVVKGLDALPFECLGYNHNTMYYNPVQTQQLNVLGSSGHTKPNLLYMAELADWKSAYPTQSKPFWDMDQAVSDMMKECRNRGPFEIDNVRGRGAWIDQGRVIIHLGNKIMVDGVIQDNMRVKDSDFYYELKAGFSPPSTEYITNEDANQLYETLCKFRWSNPLYPMILLGWCIMAPFCGAFRWRPHIWITGPAGAGKTWIQDNVINRIIGDYALMATSVSTEAGIRSALGGDARPVILDEAEAHDADGARRRQKVFELARQASSESEAKIIKGTAGGGSVNYRVRSTFCFSSIGASLSQYADQTRITMLYLEPGEKYDEEKIEYEKYQFEEAARYCTKTLSEKFVDKIHGRTVRHLKDITDSVDNCTAAMATLLHSQRDGDQIGTMIGVALSWLEGRVISQAEALEWGKMHYIHQLVDGAIETDDRRCFDHLMDQNIQVRAEKKNMPYMLTIAQIIEALRFNQNLIDSDWNTHQQLGPTPEECKNALSQCGLRLTDDKGAILVANNHVWLARIYKDTQWMNGGWPNALKQIEGADNYGGNNVRIAGSSRKVVRVYLPSKES